jgi:trimeric autotransporter adhesin
MKTTNPFTGDSVSHSLLPITSHWSLIIIPLLALGCFAFSQVVQAVTPAPDGGYSGANTAEGTNALFSLTTGVWNTALGSQALFNDTTGNQNTATGYQALLSNATGMRNTGNGAQALYNNTNASFNTATGFRALYSNTTGTNNTANGCQALTVNSAGHDNTATGFQALYLNTGDGNTASGSGALYTNSTGNGNTATGYQALFSNTIGFHDTADGFQALFHNRPGSRPDLGEGSDNTAAGWQALYDNSTGRFNTAIGSNALASNTTGYFNTAVGAGALLDNADGSHNTAVGVSALSSNIGGTYNIVTGSEALQNNTFGSANVAYGDQALWSNIMGNQNVAIGDSALDSTTGSRNIGIGIAAGELLTTGDDNIDIGNRVSAVAGESGTIRIGTQGTQIATFIAAISGTAVTGTTVVVDGNGQLGVAASSARFKDGIKTMDKASEAIFALKPVTFCYKKEIDPQSLPQFGLVAEDVERVDPDLVARDAEGKVFTVRYEAVNAMLLNEFLKEHRTVQELKSTVAKQEAIIAKQQKGFESKIAQQQTQIEALTAGLQKVSAQVEMSRPAPQMALNNQ